MAEGFTGSLTVPGVDMNQDVPMDGLRLVLRATQAGVLQWKRVSGDRYEATVSPHTFSIEFRYPLYSDDVGSDRGVAVVDLPFVGSCQFFAGTHGMQLVWEI